MARRALRPLASPYPVMLRMVSILPLLPLLVLLVLLPLLLDPRVLPWPAWSLLYLPSRASPSAAASAASRRCWSSRAAASGASRRGTARGSPSVHGREGQGHQKAIPGAQAPAPRRRDRDRLDRKAGGRRRQDDPRLHHAERTARP